MPRKTYWKGEIESADPARRDATVRARLAEHAAVLVERSTGIRRRLTEAGVSPADLTSVEALRAVPPIEKTAIIADQASRPPYGTLSGASSEELVRVYVGAGPELTYFTRADLDATIGNGSWAFATNGFTAQDLVDVSIMYHWVIAGTIMDDAYRAIGCGVVPGGIGGGMQHLENVRLLQATGLFAFPTFLEELAEKASEAGIDPKRDLALRLCTIAGEMSSPDVHRRMEEFWGMSVREIYGGAEVPFTAAQCPEGGGMHLNPDFLVEVLDPQTREPVPEGTPGVLTVTETDRVAYPMIRYCTNDLTAGLDESRCPCGRTTPRLGRIIGRVGDIPRIKGQFVVPAQVTTSIADLPGLGRHQLIVDRPGTQDVATIRVEYGGADHSATAETVASRLRDGVRLGFEVELVAPGTISDDAPAVDDRRKL